MNMLSYTFFAWMLDEIIDGSSKVLGTSAIPDWVVLGSCLCSSVFVKPRRVSLVPLILRSRLALLAVTTPECSRDSYLGGLVEASCLKGIFDRLSLAGIIESLSFDGTNDLLEKSRKLTLLTDLRAFF